MKIESIKEALKQKAQSLNVTPMTVAAPVQQEQVAPATTTRPRQNAQPTQTKSPSVVVPLNAPQAPAPVPAPAAPVAEQKPTRKAPARNSRTKAKSAPLSDIAALITEILRANIDYTTLPKCGNKPVLLKGGAEHLASVFGFRTKSEIVHREFLPDTKFLMYEIATTVYDSDDNIVAVGLGSANTLETRYIKQGLAMSANTVVKMARKRSYVDAILSATGSSRIFTQDIEELAAMTEDYQDRREA